MFVLALGQCKASTKLSLSTKHFSVTELISHLKKFESKKEGYQWVYKLNYAVTTSKQRRFF